MKTKAATTSLFLLILSFTIIGIAQAQNVTVGVHDGDTFKYNLTFLWTSSIPGQIPPQNLIQSNQTDYFQIKVTQAVGTTVQYEWRWRFLNGTEVNNTEITEVSTGLTGSTYIFAANLTSNGPLFPSATDMPWMINDTQFRTYPDGSYRTTNHIEVNRTDIDGEQWSYMNLYFDQQTGVMVEAFLTDVYTTTPTQTTTRHLLLKESSVWTVPEFPPTLILPFVMVGAVTVALLYKKKHPMQQNVTIVQK